MSRRSLAALGACIAALAAIAWLASTSREIAPGLDSSRAPAKRATASAARSPTHSTTHPTPIRPSRSGARVPTGSALQAEDPGAEPVLGRVGGVVLDDVSGAPIAGAQVEFLDEEGARATLVRTGARGEFSADALDASRHPWLEASHPCYASAVIRGLDSVMRPDSTPVEVRLAPLLERGFLDIALRDSTGAPISASATADISRQRDDLSESFECPLDSLCRARIEVAAGIYTIDASIARADLPEEAYWVDGVENVTVTAGAIVPATLVLRRRTKLTGHVRDASETVSIQVAHAPESLLDAIDDQVIEVDEAGAFETYLDRPHPARVRVVAESGASAWQSIPLPEGGAASATFTIDPALPALTGRVTVADKGTPIEGAQVRRIVDPDDPSTAETDEEGRFTLRSDRPARAIVVSADGAVEKRVEVGGSGSLEVALVVNGTLSVRVVSEKDADADGLVLVVRDAQGAIVQAVTEGGLGDDPDEMELAPGKYTVRLERLRTAVSGAEESVVVRPTEETKVTLTLPSPPR